MFNNFSFSKCDSPSLPGAYADPCEHNVMVHNKESPSLSETDQWSVRRRSSIIQPRLARTNSVIPNAEDESDVDSCFSESDFSETDSDFSDSDFPSLARRHSVPSLHSMANLDVVKFLVRPISSRTGDQKVHLSPKQNPRLIFSSGGRAETGSANNCGDCASGGQGDKGGQRLGVWLQALHIQVRKTC